MQGLSLDSPADDVDVPSRGFSRKTKTEWRDNMRNLFQTARPFDSRLRLDSLEILNSTTA